MDEFNIYEKAKNVGKEIAYYDVLHEVNDWIREFLDADCSVSQIMPFFELAQYIITKVDEIP